MGFFLRNAFIIILLCIGSLKADIPDCDYFDTVELTESNKFPNGSYLYESLVIPPEQTGEYEYEILEDGAYVLVTKHLRGCACKLSTCLRFCCHENLALVEGERKCRGDITQAVEFNPYLNITQNDGTEVVKHILDDFIVQRHLPVPCSAHFHIDDQNNKEDAWKLFENGSLLIVSVDHMLSKQSYCLQPYPIEVNGLPQIKLVPHMCRIEKIYGRDYSAMNILRLLTIICLIVTIFIYLWFPKLRSLHSYCFICYMICIAITFLILLVQLTFVISSKWVCLFCGNFGYFVVMAAFFWLTVISFDLWNTFRDNNLYFQHTAKSHFFIYSLYAWGMALLLTSIVIIIDNTLDISDENNLSWMPGVGLHACWIKTHDWSAMIYLFGPMALQIIFNVTMFILTATRIFALMKELESFGTHRKGKKRLEAIKETYNLLLRLFVIMGVQWAFEIFSYLSMNQGVFEEVFLFFDYINSAQGIIIFVMFVLKRDVLKLISDSIRGVHAAADVDDSEEEIALQERNQTAKINCPTILR